ncbi:MAG TPA: hypothetical protein VFK13_15190 [Gemmatimonadaceae bacterium]|nr:hypothetical protein [Gemmatimonadaceae bacterium]
MALWDKVKQELDRAGKVAQETLDEGRVRLEAFRARQLADKAAQALGYAVFRARQGGGELPAEEYATLSSALAAREADAHRLEVELESLRKGRRERGATTPPDGADASPGTPPTP